MNIQSFPLQFKKQTEDDEAAQQTENSRHVFRGFSLHSRGLVNSFVLKSHVRQMNFNYGRINNLNFVTGIKQQLGDRREVSLLETSAVLRLTCLFGSQSYESCNIKNENRKSNLMSREERKRLKR